MPDSWGNFALYLVNNTATGYRQVKILTEMFTSSDEDLLESSHARRDLSALPPESAILLEETPYWDLDFVIWYELDWPHPTLTVQSSTGRSVFPRVATGIQIR